MGYLQVVVGPVLGVVTVTLFGVVMTQIIKDWKKYDQQAYMVKGGI